MNVTRRITALAAAAAVIASGLTLQTATAAEPDVYTTPGGHTTNGRLWQTSCEMYSSNVVRCRTEIFSTMVVREGNRYVTDTDFHFNNLTYLPSNRAAWANNPLGKTGTFTSEGREWKTECDTAATGRGACRSYAKTRYVAREGGAYVTKNDFVFNNIVRFAQGDIKPVTRVPADALAQSTLGFNGFGPLKIDSKFSDLGRLGYAKFVTDGACDAYWTASDQVSSRGIDISRGHRDGSVWYVSIDKPTLKTEAGAHPGMTVGQVKALYGSAFSVVPKTNYGVTQYFGSVRDGERELLFRVAGTGENFYAPTRPLVDSDVIIEIRASEYTTDVSFDGC